MHKFVRNLVTEWRRLKLPFSDAAVVIAVSGGADSVAMLYALAELKTRRKLDLNFVVAHLNHCLRGTESDGDAEFVRDLAVRLELPVVVGDEAISRKGNLEQNARRARYEFLARTATENAALYIVTAHTVNDQAETVLMNLLRGSGVSGLSGMKSVTETDDAAELRLVRPLLTWAKREDTRSFCDENGHQFREDSMNEDERFTRVRIRRTLIPALCEYNPKIVETLSRTAFVLQNLKPQKAFVESATLGVSELRQMGQPERFERLRGWLKSSRGDVRGLGLKHYEAISRLISSNRSGRLAELPGGSVVKSNGRLSWVADGDSD